MSATNKTEYYELPQFEASDKPAWLTDFNNAMATIDTALHAISESNTEIDLKTINGESLLGTGNIPVQTPLTIDTAPTENSNNPVSSGGAYSAITGISNNLTNNYVPKNGYKTINGQSIIGEGNIVINETGDGAENANLPQAIRALTLSDNQAAFSTAGATSTFSITLSKPGTYLLLYQVQTTTTAAAGGYTAGVKQQNGEYVDTPSNTRLTGSNPDGVILKGASFVFVTNPLTLKLFWQSSVNNSGGVRGEIEAVKINDFTTAV